MNYKSYYKDEKTSYHSYRMADCNLVDPYLYFSHSLEEHFLDMELSVRQMHPSYNILTSSQRLELFFRLKAKAMLESKDKLAEMTLTKLPTVLESLFQERKKKAQQKLINGITFDTDMLINLPIQAWRSFKLPYSRFLFEYNAKELVGRVYPSMMYKDENGILDYVGFTDLTEAEMRVAIEKKHRVICDFIGTEDVWYCFFRTEAGIKGNEAPHIGQPHIHYISSAWGMSRNEVLSNLSSYRYSLKADTIVFKPRVEVNTADI